MAKIKGRGKPVRIEAGDRIQMVEAQTWSGVLVPVGTMGTVEHDPEKRSWSVVWDGFPRLQPNGYPFGIGVCGPTCYCPRWARKPMQKWPTDQGAAGMEDACGING